LDFRFLIDEKIMREIQKLQPPLSEADVRALKAGDEVLITGVIYGARDMAHKRLCHEGLRP
jgi:tartrate dehydratase beta subunit/fumarate hydratase class I family protein